MSRGENVTDMNALPLKTGSLKTGPLSARPQDAIDQLIADYGVIKVFLTVLARLIKRTRPPDRAAQARKPDPRQLSMMDDHIRADMGLPPSPKSTLQIDLMAMNRHSIF